MDVADTTEINIKEIALIHVVQDKGKRRESTTQCKYT